MIRRHLCEVVEYCQHAQEDEPGTKPHCTWVAQDGSLWAVDLIGRRWLTYQKLPAGTYRSP